MLINKNSFTYGFELEGSFHENILDRLGIENPKEDGSVNIDHNYDWRGEEIDLGIFQTFNAMMEKLKMFTSDVYRSNQTCGLHVHIKPKKHKLTNFILDFTLIQKLQKYAESELCLCVQDRLQNNTYCRKYQDIINTHKEIKRYEKYRFFRNHPIETLEFRFFSACSHKIDNVNKFLGFLVKAYNDNAKQMFCKKKTTTLNNADHYDYISEPYFYADNTYDYELTVEPIAQELGQNLN
ncbi:hypothetical protein CL633_04455 [bacterium]|jgi:hypothetical protein|nr:hypothetical protein [bacterium]|tara:strand:- start:6064 stop:6777 length:714 start_codon:yes stop_codon:yes gene_type:complete